MGKSYICYDLFRIHDPILEESAKRALPDQVGVPETTIRALCGAKRLKGFKTSTAGAAYRLKVPDICRVL